MGPVTSINVYTPLVRRRFDLPYACMAVPAEQLRAWDQPDQALAGQLALPPRNHYVPTDFHLHGGAGTDEARSQETKAAEAAAKALCAGVPNKVSSRFPLDDLCYAFCCFCSMVCHGADCLMALAESISCDRFVEVTGCAL